MTHEYEECVAARERIANLEIEKAEMQHRLDEALDMVEYFKHCLSENAWHFREATDRLTKQMNHPEWEVVQAKRAVEAEGPRSLLTPSDIEVARATEGTLEYPEVSRNPYAIGQRS